MENAQLNAVASKQEISTILARGDTKSSSIPKAKLATPGVREEVMLVLSRKLSQQIVIGTDVRITVVKIERNQVRIGIDAPDDVAILRGELIENFLDQPETDSDSEEAVEAPSAHGRRSRVLSFEV